MTCLEKFKYHWHIIIKGYPPHKWVNGVKVRYTSKTSVNREDAIRANWDTIKEICGKLK